MEESREWDEEKMKKHGQTLAGVLNKLYDGNLEELVEDLKRRLSREPMYGKLRTTINKSLICVERYL